MPQSPAMQRPKRSRPTSSTASAPAASPQARSAGPRRTAVVGAGVAGLACARTLAQAGHEVTVFERHTKVGGRMATRETPFGTFDHGTQYFTVRDERFARVLKLHPGLCKPWAANAVRVLDPLGRVTEAPMHRPEAHWVPVPDMGALPRAWAEPMIEKGRLQLEHSVQRIGRDAADGGHWRLSCETRDGPRELGGFDELMLALPAAQAADLLRTSSLAPGFIERLEQVRVAPCWTLMVAFPNAQQAGQLGPQWNAASSSHHRIAWISRESSKPGREAIERWTVQASAGWSTEHLEDDPQRIEAKLIKGFAEVTGIRAEPGHAQVHRWRHAKTHVPLGQSHLLDRQLGLGLCGDWCLGHRVEDAFVSGLELALGAL